MLDTYNMLDENLNLRFLPNSGGYFEQDPDLMELVNFIKYELKKWYSADLKRK